MPVGLVYNQKLKFRSKILVKYGKPIMPEEISVSEKPLASELKNAKERIMDEIKYLVEGENHGGN